MKVAQVVHTSRRSLSPPATRVAVRNPTIVFLILNATLILLYRLQLCCWHVASSCGIHCCRGWRGPVRWWRIMVERLVEENYVSCTWVFRVTDQLWETKRHITAWGSLHHHYMQAGVISLTKLIQTLTLLLWPTYCNHCSLLTHIQYTLKFLRGHKNAGSANFSRF